MKLLMLGILIANLIYNHVLTCANQSVYRIYILRTVFPCHVLFVGCLVLTYLQVGYLHRYQRLLRWTQVVFFIKYPYVI